MKQEISHDNILMNIKLTDVVCLTGVIALMALPFLPLVPEPSSVSSIVFVVAFGSGLFVAMYDAVRRGMNIRSPGIMILIVLSVLAASYPLAAYNNVSILDWVRGFLPFTALTTYFLYSSCTLKDVHGKVVISALLYSVYVLVSAYLQEGGLAGIVRLSLVSSDSVIPMPLIGFVMTLLYPFAKGYVKAFTLIFFVLVIILVGYRSQILIVAVLGAWYLFVYSKASRGVGLIFVAVSVVFVLIFAEAAVDAIMYRFTLIGEGGDVVRQREWQYALMQFFDSPLFGRGLSFPVSVSFTRGEVLSLSEYDADNVRYVHNVIAYLLMDVGLIGVIVYFLPIMLAVWQGWRSVNIHQKAAALALLCLVAFFMTSASFRQIQSNFLVGLLIALACRQLSELPPQKA